jgi:hypothetical protein
MNSYGTHRAITGAMTGALALMMGASTAMAEVTPADVWADWQAYLGGFGFAVTADEAQTAQGLGLTDIVLTQTLPDDAGETMITIPQVMLQDNGDGTVGVVYPTEMPIKIGVSGDDAYTLELLYRTEDMVSTVSGDPSRMTYDYSAAGIGLTASSLTSEGENVDLGEAVFDMKDVKGRTVMIVDGGRTAEQQVTTGPATYSTAFTDPENAGSTANVTGQFESLDMMAKVILPQDTDMDDMSAALAAGFALDGGYVFGAGNSTFEFTEDDAVTSGTSSSAGGKLTIRMDEGGLAYGGTLDDMQVEVTVPQMPFALSMGMAEATFDLAMPLTQDEAPQDFGLNFLLGGVTLGDTVWALFDSQGMLPRDPATVALDLEGKASILADILDPAQIARMEEGADAPAEVNALTLNQLLVSLAGAELTGQGAVTFDNTDMTSYDGKPKPVGDVALRLTGANTLLDKLVAMGLLAQDQAMGARMMLGMAAVPGEGEDVLTSTIEFTEEGGIVANGQRLK